MQSRQGVPGRHPRDLLCSRRVSSLPVLKPRIASPCISVCRLDPFEDVCVGCLRTTQEIAEWTRYSDEERRVIMDSLKARRAQSKTRIK